MKLSLPTIVDNHNDVPGVFNVADGGNAAVPIANNVAQHGGNNVAMASNDAPNDALVIKNASANNAPTPTHNVAAALPCNNFSTSKNAAVPALNSTPVPADAPAVDSAAPALDAPVPVVDAVVFPAPSNAPTINNAPTNVVVKMEQMESDEVVNVQNKNFKECVMYVLDHTNDEDYWKITFVPLTSKIKVEPGIQGTSLEAGVPSSASDIGTVSTAALPLSLLVLLSLQLSILLPLSMLPPSQWGEKKKAIILAFWPTKMMKKKNNHMEMMVVFVRLLVRLP